LLDQARREVLDSALEIDRLRSALQAIARAGLVVHETERFTPLAFPLWAERLRNRLTTQRWQDRVAKMVAQLERAADRT
jgi:ATP-dependent Lhr-like helicase